ncbi:hypothetical protein [Mycobacterium kyorinense]|uniref:Uncharacterized protein n=1 Tax=Mycobacterium kyorinense TaxID=487514 RepID=A0A1X1Y013_9MYCO|nr:hypothetical protein [Mycobacterium kyorinense]ORW04438.1 hypothetical protein AWC14_04190 [Mycobacterium kyorinense]
MKQVFLVVFGLLFFSIFGTSCLVWTIVVLGRNEYLTAVAVFGFAALCFGFVALFIKVRLGAITARVTYEPTGTTLRPDRGAVLLGGIAVVGGEVAMGLGAVLAFFGRLDVPLGPGQRLDRLVGMGAVGALLGVPTMWRMFTRGTYLRLTPTGFEASQGWPSAAGEWVEVKDVTDHAPGRRAVTARGIVIVMSDGRTPTLATGMFTPDGRALRELVWFYWQHPEFRSELTDGRALERLNKQRFE